MADDMVLDAAVEAEPLETSVEETVEVPEPGTETEVDGAEPGNTDSEEDAPVGSVWREVKERLKDAPNLHRQVKAALHSYERAKAAFPDGVEAAVKRLEAINQLDDDPKDPDYLPGSRTPEEVLSNTVAERGFWRDFDNAFQGGDARVINQMIEANPTSFQKLIPEAMDRFQELNPDGYSAYVCKSVDAHLVQQKIPLQLEILDMLLPQSSDDPGTARVLAAFKAIKGVFEGIQTAAKGSIAPKQIEGKQAGTQTTQTQPQSDSREMNLRHDEWLSAIRPRSEAFAASEALKLAGKSRFTPAELGKIKNFVRTEVNVRTKANDAYQKRVVGFLKANNKTAYAMTVESEHKKIISEAVKRIVPQVLGERTKPGPKAGQAKAEQAKPGAGAVAKPGDEQYELIAGPPRTMGLKVDFKRTNNSMLAGDRAFIVGRVKPVRWRRK